MKKLFAIALLASITTLAAPLQWICDWPEAKSQTFSLYQGETATFEPTFRVNGRTVTNATIEAVWYQTNGMANAWWKLDDATFAPSNDVGAAAYRFFVEAKASGDTIYRANGALRMLPSPGFTPNAIEPPVQTLDFATVDVLNPPWTDPDYSINNTALVETIETTAPAPGNYAAVSNAAMTAVQPGSLSFTNDYIRTSWKDDNTSEFAGRANEANYADRAGEADWADYASSAGDATEANHSSSADSATYADRAGISDFSDYAQKIEFGANLSDAKSGEEMLALNKNYTDNATSNLARVAHTGSYNDLSNKPTIPTAEDVYRIVAGTNIVLVVTNYNSATHAPAMKLQHFDPQSGEYVTYWDETRQHAQTFTNAMDYTDAQVATRAPKAWSRTTSGLGSEAPDGVTWISTPETVIAGGYEYEKVITSSGAVWVLSSNGLTTGATTNAFFRVTATDGTELFAIEKTDSFLIGVNPDGITRVDNTVTIPVNVVADAHPYIRATTNLVNAVWTKEDEDGFTCPWATVSWSGTTGAYVATVTCSEPQAFFYFEYLVEGVAKIKNSATVEMTGGIYFNGYRYMPVVNGSKLEFVRQ